MNKRSYISRDARADHPRKATHMIIHNGDHLEFEREHVNTPPHERPDWPLPSFDARDWAAAFVKLHGGDESLMLTWFANALIRGYDEASSRKAASNKAYQEVIEAAKSSLTSINAIASPNPERTFDGVIRDLDMITDIARAALARLTQGGVDA